MTIEETTGRSGHWLDVGTLMARASAANDTELAEYGQYQRTLLDEAEMAYTAFKIGVWQLGQENHDEARRWLSTAVESGIIEARPLLRICVLALDPVPEHREALLDADEDALADTLLADAEHQPCGAAEAPLPEDTPIFRAVLDQEASDLHREDGAPPAAPRVEQPAPPVLPDWKPIAARRRLPGQPFDVSYRRLVITFTGDEGKALPAAADAELVPRPQCDWVHRSLALQPFGQFLHTQSLLSMFTAVKHWHQEQQAQPPSELGLQPHPVNHAAELCQRLGRLQRTAPEALDPHPRVRSRERVLACLLDGSGEEALLALTTWAATEADAGWWVHDDVIALLRERITATGLILPAGTNAGLAPPGQQDTRRQGEVTGDSDQEQRPLPGMERAALV